jgi:hypothetical protein
MANLDSKWSATAMYNFFLLFWSVALLALDHPRLSPSTVTPSKFMVVLAPMMRLILYNLMVDRRQHLMLQSLRIINKCPCIMRII